MRLQWVEYRTRLDFRRALRKRAGVWSGEAAQVRVYGSAETFLRSLEAAAMLRIEVEE